MPTHSLSNCSIVASTLMGGKGKVETSNEQRIARKNSPLIPILEEVTNTILGVAWSVERFNRYSLTNLEDFTMCGRFGDQFTVLPSYDG
jgi:hypothetical protein